MSDPPPEAENDLYAGSLHSFVARRKALAAALKARGEAAEGKRIAKLKKPPVTVWALNRLAVTAREDLARVLAAIDRQRDLQLGALEGKLDAAALEAARADERGGLATLLDRATPLLEDDGHVASKATLDRMATTLRRVALDPDRREALERGCLADEGDDTGGLEAVAAQLDPALLLAALKAGKEPARPKKKRRSADSFLARTARADRRRGRASAPSPPDPPEDAPTRHAAEEAAELARKRAEVVRKERARLEDKRASIQRDLEALDAELEGAQGRRAALEQQRDEARAEVRRLRRKQEHDRARIAALERQLRELGED